MSHAVLLCTMDQPDVCITSLISPHRVVASANALIPMLWNVLFSPQDLVAAKIEIDGEVDAVWGPIADKMTACARLEARVAWVSELFAEEGSLREHAAILDRALRRTDGKYVTIALDQLDEADPDFRAEYLDLLRRLAGGREAEARANDRPIPGQRSPSWFARLIGKTDAPPPTRFAQRTTREALVAISEYPPGAPFPSPQIAIAQTMDDASRDLEAEKRLVHLLGGGWEEAVAWD